MIGTMVRLTALVLLVTGGLGGCGALDVSDPTAVEDSDLNDAAGAELLRRAARKTLATSIPDAIVVSGLLADEFLADPSPSTPPGTSAEEMLDRRESTQYEELGSTAGYFGWHSVRRAAAVALPKLQAYALPSARVHIGEMFAVRGFATLNLAEEFCPGFPLHDVVNYSVVFGSPLSTDEALERALADFDSALVYTADSARILNFARLGRGRTLLALGRFAAAAAAVAEVPNGYVAQAEFNPSILLSNALASTYFSPFNLTRSVADREGTTGLNFVSANDPRVLTIRRGTAQDRITGIYAPAKYQNTNAPIALASSVEARLIEAEAALKGGGDWRTMLNALRTTCTDPATCPTPAPAGTGGVGGLPPLADPGTDTARVDLLFRERAFWLFATAHRLGDLRRLVAHYGRAAENIFPTGAYRRGGVYGTATSIPFPVAKEAPFNPAVTGCTVR